MEKYNKYIFLLACIVIVVIAQRENVNFPTARFNFGHFNPQSLITRFCKHFCNDSDQKANRASKTFSLCSMKCKGINTMTNQKPINNPVEENPSNNLAPGNLPKANNTLNATNTLIAGDTSKKNETERTSNNGGTIIVIDKSATEPREPRE